MLITAKKIHKNLSNELMVLKEKVSRRDAIGLNVCPLATGAS